ncbi:juvenile hormone esterase-like [Drosophila tropicalis]|uniref:juvenile hormone esterase-like n=1 Tax=Drosophila tropicalis TaxID=46794 RepID=UPI0035ABDCDA
MKGYQTLEFQAFLGIPYALPPLGDLRFERPRRMGKLFGTSDASKPKPDCINKNYLLSTPKVYGEEDCLYLNVYRPMPLSESPLPVMVYIHGGGFIGGSAGPLVSGPEYFMDSQAVILVTVSYRVGVFGFLSTGDGNMPGNFGLKDQNMALKWVQDNIHYYGGDQQKVTLFGHGIDGIATHLHLMSNMSAGLFHRVISMSGTAIAPTAINRNPLEQARNVAEFCRIPNANNMSEAELTDALKYVDADVLVNAGDGFKYWDADPLHIYRPVIESANQDAFLTAEPELLMEQGNYIKVPWLLGSVPSDGAVRVVKIYENFELRYQFNLQFHDLLKKLTEFSSKYNDADQDEKTRTLIEEYLNNIHELESQTVDGLLHWMTDRHFNYPLYKTVRYYVRSGDDPIYIYNFNYRGPHSYASIYANAKLSRSYGVVHGDDLLYLFRSPLFFPDFKKNSTDAKLITSFVDYFVTFARNGRTNFLPHMRNCTRYVFAEGRDSFCDYHHFEYRRGGFYLRVSNQFPSDKVKLWMYLSDET